MNPTQPINAAAPQPLRWRIRNWLFRELFAAEYIQLHRWQEVAQVHLREVERLEREINLFTQARRARFKLDGGLPEEEIQRRLAGQAETPVMQAVTALIDAKIVEMSDRATNPPSEINTQDLRTYESGGANAIAEFKARLQEVTCPMPAQQNPLSSTSSS